MELRNNFHSPDSIHFHHCRIIYLKLPSVTRIETVSLRDVSSTETASLRSRSLEEIISKKCFCFQFRLTFGSLANNTVYPSQGLASLTVQLDVYLNNTEPKSLAIQNLATNVK